MADDHPRWVWEPLKAAANRREHGISFELAERVLRDPWHTSRPDEHPREERWQTIGKPSADSGLVLLVVHTEPRAMSGGALVGRIISARDATPKERRAYEEGEF